MEQKCLSNEMLYHYIFDKLAERQKKRVINHLNHCPSCQEEYTILKAVLFDPDLSEWDSLNHQETTEIMNELGIANSTFVNQVQRFDQTNYSNVLKFIIKHYKNLKENALDCLERIRMYFSYTSAHGYHYKFTTYAWQPADSKSIRKRVKNYAITRVDSPPFENLIAINKKLKKMKIEIFFEKNTQNSVLMRVKLKKHQDKAKSTFVTLLNNESKMAIRQFKDGWAYIDNLQLSSYRITLTQGKKELGSYAFELSEAGLNET
ncbi:hypothetical protein MHK_007972 [Candidatus Magnetomorum sp. HK-1]|nr:hypothetical protein MHK_007972 [Candidatus Magnetomorum sp. HK-1]